MDKERTTVWDAASYLETEEDMAAYLEAALEENDAALVAAALGDIARAKGMTYIAKQTGLARESLYKALSSEGNPDFATVLKVVHALGLRLRATRSNMGAWSYAGGTEVVGNPLANQYRAREKKTIMIGSSSRCPDTHALYSGSEAVFAIAEGEVLMVPQPALWRGCRRQKAMLRRYAFWRSPRRGGRR